MAVISGMYALAKGQKDSSNATAIEIAHIAGDHRERVNLGGGGDQHVGLCAALATRLQMTLGYETLNTAHVL